MTISPSPLYIADGFEFKVRLELRDMPETPKHYSDSKIIAEHATVVFKQDTGVLQFTSISLTGMRALKGGGPSKLMTSDSYWNYEQEEKRIPEPIEQVIAFAETLIKDMLR